MCIGGRKIGTSVAFLVQHVGNHRTRSHSTHPVFVALGTHLASYCFACVMFRFFGFVVFAYLCRPPNPLIAPHPCFLRYGPRSKVADAMPFHLCFDEQERAASAAGWMELVGRNNREGDEVNLKKSRYHTILLGVKVSMFVPAGTIHLANSILCCCF